MTLLKQQAKAEGLSLVVWGLALGGLVLWATALWPTLMSSDTMVEIMNLLNSLPPALRAAIGGASLATITGWVTAYAFGLWVLVPYMVFTALFATSIVSREMDRRTIEFLLSLPTSRSQLLLTRWAGMAIALVLIQLFHFGGAVVGVLLIGERVDVGALLLAELNLWLLLLALGSLFLLISLLIDDYGRSLGATLGLGFVLFFAHLALDGKTGALSGLRDALPFAQFRPAEPLLEATVPTGSLLYLALLTLAAVCLSTYLFQRKEITV